MANSQYVPLRLPESPEDAAANRADTTRVDIGVTGTLYKGEEATVVISVGDDWIYMDVEYAKLVCVMLAEVIKGGLTHNRELGLTP